MTGIDLERVSLDRARDEARRWELADRVQFLNYDGNPMHIPGLEYDFIFTKSVLVVVPELEVEGFLAALSRKLAFGGELMAAENLAGGRLLRLVRRFVIHRRWRGVEDAFHGVDKGFLSSMSKAFEITGFKSYYGLVAAIRGHRRPSLLSPHGQSERVAD